MEDIIREVAYGDTIKTMRITMPFGSGRILHLMVDDYYLGQLSYRRERWVFLPQKEEKYTMDDIQAIEDLVNSQAGSPDLM